MQSKLRKFFLYQLTVIVITTLLIGCDWLNPMQPPSSGGNYRFSFEDGMEGWTVNGTDLDNPPVDWSINLSKEVVKGGKNSVKLYLDNLNDAGKIWIQRQFSVEPNSYYHVNVKYNFASSDWGDLNLWTIITGVLTEEPLSRDVLVYQGDTGNNAEDDAGYVWLDKSYDFTVQSDSDGILYVIIGVWGTWETARTYYLDRVQVNFTKLEGDVNWSLQGQWKVSVVRFDNEVVQTYNIDIEQSDSSVKFIRDSEVISSCVISGNTLLCSDWYGYGIRKIYIDSQKSMYSETPQNEFLNRVNFRKIENE